MKQSKAVYVMLLAYMTLMIAGSVSAADPSAEAAPIQPDAISPETAPTNETVAVNLPARDQAEGEIVSLHVVDMDISEVMKTFLRIPGVNIVIGSNITGKVTVHVTAPWKVALNAILFQQKLMLQESADPGVYTIVPKSSEDPLVTETIFLRFAEVPSVITVLKNAMEPRGKIADFSSRNAMVIQSTQRNLNELKAIVEQIDIPRRQVFIEAQFVELSDTTESNIGVGWDMLKSYNIAGQAQVLNSSEKITRTDDKTDLLSKSDWKDGTDTMKGNYNIKGSTLVPTDRSRGVSDTLTKSLTAEGALKASAGRVFSDVRTAILNPLEFSLVLSALKTRGGTTILSKPKIIVANGEQAMIHIGEERRPFIATVSPATQTTAPFTTYNPGEAVQFGVKIVVTPTINTGSNITVMIEPELTRLAGMDTAPDGKTSYPIKATKKIKTQFTLENYRTAAIGGLTETSDEKGSDKVPLLSDIPLIGKYLFSRESTSRKQQEMIIFVTVGIVSPDAADEKLGVPSDAELIQAYQLERKAASARFQTDIESKQADTDQRTERADKRKKMILNRIK